MAKVKRDIIAFKCTKCDSKNYTVYKTRNVKDKIELKKFCKTCKGHTEHKETKVKQ
ncbi:TPA: 50S ribosomal protein L33 [Candidatus Dojkabacteria bacterium]|jgi:large subunit ribosomal protein L33|uniref:Large ribosomal subunit protein bL33 n=1 Tax=Candidatus Dojkabacteria bacterium TaxID=2099670 RepID=A0A832QDA3_9BACT|nr:50S ribosomal protein L33 [Candidatus Dojkabacteria bacterium]HHX99188.1 50S ribosomal protein L33 [Candidatus Dojkabacteria bacterium]